MIKILKKCHTAWISGASGRDQGDRKLISYHGKRIESGGDVESDQQIPGGNVCIRESEARIVQIEKIGVTTCEDVVYAWRSGWGRRD